MTASRLQALDPAAVQCVVATAQALGMGRIDQAEARLRPLLDSHPDHPEVLRLYAGILSSRGNHTGALAAMRRAVAQRPSDPLFYNTLGSVLGDMGDFDAAIDALRRACGLQPGLAVAWYNLGVMLTRCVRNTEAAGVIRRAVALAPGNMDARALLGDLLRMQGDAAASAIEYRKVLSEHPFSGMAWWGLADLRTGAFEPGDIERMHAALRDSRASDDDRIAIGFAQARALDEAGRRDEALDALAHANAVARSRQRWDASGFSAGIDQANRSFTPPPVGAATSRLGHEVVFIVGIPRSGTTLVEQILASHSLIEGAGELPDLPLVLAEESRHRGQPFPNWVAAMNPADWQRLGERYLDRTAYWRRERPGFTDKLPNNWMYMGAIRAMLPGARIVVCRRDPLETCFSCYRQYMSADGQGWTHRFEDLAAYWNGFDRMVQQWQARYPGFVYTQDYENLLADPEAGVRALLAFCGLPFDDACLAFGAGSREVRSPSAMQVREPLRRDTARAPSYGALLDPLRSALGIVDIQSAH